MTIYLAGPMTGYPLWNFPAFDAAAAWLRAAGHVVKSPAEMDRSWGLDENTMILPARHRRESMTRNCMNICLYADALAVLPGWGYSSGARAEVMLAVALGLPIYDVWTMDPLEVSGVIYANNLNTSTKAKWDAPPTQSPTLLDAETTKGST